MGLFKRKSNKEFEMRDVYAGPEQMGVPTKRVVPPRENNQARMQAVYAAPDVMEKMRVPDLQSSSPNEKPPYPMNNIPVPPVSPAFQLVYAGPDMAPFSPGKGMASPETPGYINNDDTVKREIITCPECGEQTRHGKFCECCGAVLK